MARYSMEDGTGTTITDVIGGVNLTTNGTWPAGKWGSYAAGFAATQLATGASTNLPVGASARSVSVWVKTVAPTDTYEGVFFYGTAGSALGCAIFYNTSLIQWDFQNRHVASTTGIPTDGNWYHIVCTYDGSGTCNTSTCKIYVNGVSKALTTTAGSVNTASGTTFQMGGSIAGWMEGYIDEFQMFDYVLSPTEVSLLYTNAAPLLNEWTITDGGFDFDFPMESLSGINVVNRTGSLTLTGTGTPTVESTNPPPTAATSIEYINPGGALTEYHTNVGGLGLSTLYGKEYFVELWLRPVDGSLAYVYRIGNSTASGNQTISFVIGSPLAYFYYNGPAAGNINTGFTTSVWTHWAVVYQSGTFTVYKNAVSVGSAVVTMLPFEDQLYLAYSPHFASGIRNGRISGFRIKELKSTFDVSMLNYP